MAMKNEQGWVIVDGVHCCYCQLAEWACPNHTETDTSYEELLDQPKYAELKIALKQTEEEYPNRDIFFGRE